jgi:hypothetical protein
MGLRAPTGRHGHPEQGDKTAGGAPLASLAMKNLLFIVTTIKTYSWRKKNNRENNRTIAGA